MDQPVQQPISTQPVQAELPQKEKKPSSLPRVVLIILGVLIVLGLTGGAYLLGTKNHPSEVSTHASDVLPTPTVSVAADYTEADYQKASEESKTFLLNNLSLKDGKYVGIPQTDLEIQIPSSYTSQPIEKDAMLEQTLLLNYNLDLPKNLQPLMYHPGGWSGDFRIGIVATNISPQEWVLDNIIQQGIKLRDEPVSQSRGTSTTINGNQFLMINGGCCAVSYYLYFMQYVDTNKQKIILVFATHNVLGSEDSLDQKNIVLDTLLATLRKKQL